MEALQLLVGVDAELIGELPGDTAALRRIAMIQLWQATAMMSLDEIRTILSGGTRDRDWREAIRDRIAICDNQLDRLTSARAYLSHMLESPSDHPADRRPYLAEQIDDHLRHLTIPRRDPSPHTAAGTRQQRSPTP